MSGWSVDLHLANGRLRQLLRGVYVDRRVPDSLPTRARAAALVLPSGAALGRRTAAWLYGVDARAPGELSRPLSVECIVPRGVVPPRHAGLVAYTGDLPAGELTSVEGLPVTTPGRTAVDCARYQPHWLGLSTVDAMLHTGLTKLPELSCLVEQNRGGRWIARARRVVASAEPLAESAGESWLRLRLLEAGFPRPVAQHVVRAGGLVVARLDLADLEHRVGYEYDGEAHHTSKEDRERDRHRREELQALGWRLVVARKSDVLGSGMQLEETVAGLLGCSVSARRQRWEQGEGWQ